MIEYKHLVVGAGVSGLAYVNFLDSDDYLILERDDEVGGYCKTIKQDGFVWDYSGHFFHFRHPEIEKYLVDRMPAGTVKTVCKASRIYFDGALIDFPFQKNIHQLPKDDFIDCLYELYFRPESKEPPRSFAQMLVQKFGRGIAQRFLMPYNEKLYACDLEELDPDAMGRFFPHADIDEIIRNFKEADNLSYNATFTYPEGGAIEYINALAREVRPGGISLGEGLERIDLEERVALTSRGRQIRFEHLVSSAPLDALLRMTGTAHDPSVFSSNKVAVFNLGFDAKGLEGVHWVYFPNKEHVFYRVGFYDNIMDTGRMSLYVEVGMQTEESVDVEGLLQRVLEDLKKTGVVEGQRLLSWHHVVLDPAYVHITRESLEATASMQRQLQGRGVHSVGRYGGWTYCSIEDNILETRALAQSMNGAERGST